MNNFDFQTIDEIHTIDIQILIAEGFEKFLAPIFETREDYNRVILVMIF